MDPYWCGLNHMQIPKSISVTRIRRHFDWPKPISCGLRCSGQWLASLLEASQVRGVRRGAIAQGGGCHCQKMVMRSAKLSKIIDVSSWLCIYMYIWVQAHTKSPIAPCLILPIWQSNIQLKSLSHPPKGPKQRIMSVDSSLGDEHHYSWSGLYFSYNPEPKIKW